MKHCIALLGFAETPAAGNLILAVQLGRSLAQRGWTLAVGNTQGTFAYALMEASSNRGQTLAVLERNRPLIANRHLQHVTFADSQDQKHEYIADTADAGVIIGGGHGSLKLIQQFIKRDKPLCAISRSGGIVDSELPRQVTLYQEIYQALDAIEQHGLQELRFSQA